MTQSSKAAVFKMNSNILQNVGMIKSKKNPKTARQLERHVKGAANHWRISILLLIQKRGGLTLDQLVTNLDANAKTISVHTQKLAHAGLLSKKYVGKHVIHTISPYGILFCNFLKSF